MNNNHSRKFGTDDLVFAKMKYEPPWPSVIIEVISNKKYKVMFYGTRQTRILPPEAIVPYNQKYIKRFIVEKSFKRKHFKAAFDELEKVIAERGGSPGDHQDSFVTSSASPSKDPEVPEQKGEKVLRTDDFGSYSLISLNDEIEEKPKDKNAPGVNKDLLIHKMVRIIQEIKQSLGLMHADVDKAIEGLKAIKNNVLPSISDENLISYPDTVKVIKRLRNYVGKVACWNLDNFGIQQFNAKAKVLCKLANEIYEEIKTMFSYLGSPSGNQTKTFWDAFVEEVERRQDSPEKIDD